MINMSPIDPTSVPIPASGTIVHFLNLSGVLSFKTSSGTVGSYSTGISSEDVQDIVGTLIQSSSTAQVTYNDAGNALTIAVLTSALNHGELLNSGTNTHAQIDSHIASVANPHATTKAQVGLGSVDNTTDLLKPISTATQVALNAKYDATNPNNYETPTQLNARDTANRTRSNHTGSQTASTLSDFSSAALAVVLTGLSTATNAAITAADSILSALGKIQAQITDHFGAGGTAHSNATVSVSGFMSPADKVKLDGITNSVFATTLSDLTNSSNATLVNISDLTIPVVAGKNYRIEGKLIFRSSASPTGIGFTMLATGAVGTLALNVRSQSGNDGTGGQFSGAVTSFGDIVTSSSVQVANTRYILEYVGIFVCTTSGDILPQFRAEINGNTISILTGSIVEWKEY